MRHSLARWAALTLAALAAACSKPAVEGAGDDWITPGGDAGKSHYSRLTDIDTGNVGRLGLAWSEDLGTNRGMEATPVVIGGVMYVSGVAGRVYARKADTGDKLWTFEPKLDPKAYRAVCCDNVNRGVAVRDGKVYVAALDGVLYALDAKTGAIAWQVDTIEDHSHGYTSTGAPELAGDLVVIGNAGAELDTRGYVSAYNAASGKLAWRFHTIPRDPKLGPQDHPDLEAAMKTWGPESRWDIGGGGTVWDAINFDPETGLLLIGVGNGGPYPISRRSPGGGDNLYLSSIVALDPKTGRVKWHYQETPGDSWDFTATQPMILANLDLDGERRPVVIHAPKNGFLYVLDRRTGKVLRANALVRTTWASGVDAKTGRPNLTPAKSDYATGPKIVFPAAAGARNWQPGALSPQTGLVYTSVLDMGNLMFLTPGVKARSPRAFNADASIIFTPNLLDALATLPPPLRAEIEKLPELASVRALPFSSELRAIDPLTGKTVWKQTLAGWQDRGGALATAGGLVFQGDLGGHIRAFDAKTGKLLKSLDTGSSIFAAPMTYRVGKTQYVAVVAGWGGGGWPFVPRYAAAYRYFNMSRILVFKLDGAQTIAPPAAQPPLEVAPPPPAQAPGVTPTQIAEGRGLFAHFCGPCHANQLRSISPDLRRLQPATHQAFDDIVLKGALQENGMPAWGDTLSEGQAHAVHAYLIDLQGKTRTQELAKQAQGLALDAPAPVVMTSF